MNSGIFMQIVPVLYYLNIGLPDIFLLTRIGLWHWNNSVDVENCFHSSIWIWSSSCFTWTLKPKYPYQLKTVIRRVLHPSCSRPLSRIGIGNHPSSPAVPIILSLESEQQGFGPAQTWWMNIKGREAKCAEVLRVDGSTVRNCTLIYVQVSGAENVGGSRVRTKLLRSIRHGQGAEGLEKKKLNDSSALSLVSSLGAKRLSAPQIQQAPLPHSPIHQSCRLRNRKEQGSL